MELIIGYTPTIFSGDIDRNRKKESSILGKNGQKVGFLLNLQFGDLESS